MIPEYFEFMNPTKLCAGKGALENIPYELKLLGAKRPMILTDHVLEQLGLLRLLLNAMPEITIGHIFTDVPTDSSVETVNRAAQEYIDRNCDSLIALGGGSVLDTAKGVRLVISEETDHLLDLMGCECVTRGKRVPFIAIPTTAGTGSESTAVAVIKNPAQKVKMEFISGEVLPDTAVLDVRLTLGLPPKTTATTGFDTLCHAVEAYSCIQKNPLSDAYATAAVSLVAKNLVKAVKNGQDKQARFALSMASYLAGAAFSNSMVGVVHAVGHALGSVCHVPHGEAMTILLPIGMRYNLRNCQKTYGELLLFLAGPKVYAQTPETERAKAAVKYVVSLQRTLHRLTGLPVTLREAGVTKEDFAAVAQTALNDGAIIVNPRQVDEKDAIRILDAAY